MILTANSQTFQPDLKRIPQVLTIGIEDSAKINMLYSAHSHSDSMELSLNMGGRATYIVDGDIYDTEYGDLMVFEAGKTHERISEDSLQVFSCRLSGIQFNDYPENHLLPVGCKVKISCGGHFDEINMLFSLIYDNILRDSRDSNEVANYYLRSLLCVTHRLGIEGLQNKPLTGQMIAARCRKYIEEHYMESICLEDLADDLHVSRYYLTHIFTEQYQFSPKQYIIRCRIGRAQTLLLETALPVTDIALEVGFGNINHFHNTFKKYIGVSPNSYRKKWQA